MESKIFSRGFHLNIKPQKEIETKLFEASDIYDILKLNDAIIIEFPYILQNIEQLIVNAQERIIIIGIEETSYEIFNFEGKSVGKINNYGSGPNEYKIINGVKIANSKIYLMTDIYRYLFEYDFNGNLLQKFDIKNKLKYFKGSNYFPSDFFIDGNKLFIIQEIEHSDLLNNGCIIFIYDNFSNFRNYFKITYSPRPKMNSPQLFKFGDNFFLSIPLDNSIYQINDSINKIGLSTKLDFDNADFLRKLSKISSPPDILITLNDYIQKSDSYAVQYFFSIENVLFINAINSIYALIFAEENKVLVKKIFQKKNLSQETDFLKPPYYQKNFFEKHGITEYALFYPQSDCFVFCDFYSEINNNKTKLKVFVFGL